METEAHQQKANTLVQGGKVARKSFAIQLMVGISEVFMGIFTLSVALIADGSQRVIERVLGYVDGIQKLK